MKKTPPENRRARRINAALQVSFSINGGPQQISDTLNFTYRSLAIRSDCAVKKGDQVIAKIGDLPTLKGNVVRVFGEGFAIMLTEMSLALTAHAETELPRGDEDEKADLEDAGRIISPMFKIDAPFPSWGRIASSRRRADGPDRHFLSIITTDTIDFDTIKSVWVSAKEARWVARLQQASKRGKQSVIVILLNDWQLQMAADCGLCVSVICEKFAEWSADIDASAIAEHLNALDGDQKALLA